MMKNDDFKGLSIPSNELDIYHELNKTIFGGFWVILLEHTNQLTIKYKLPPSVIKDLKNGVYQLYWQKQPGVENTIIKVKVKVPRSIKYLKTGQENSSSVNSIYQYTGLLNQDKMFEIHF